MKELSLKLNKRKKKEAQLFKILCKLKIKWQTFEEINK